MPEFAICICSIVTPFSEAIAIKVSPDLIVYVYGVAVGSRLGIVGATNIGVFIGEDVVVEGNPRSTTVGAGVEVMFSGTLLIQAVIPLTNIVAYMSVLNLNLVSILIINYILILSVGELICLV